MKYRIAPAGAVVDIAIGIVNRDLRIFIGPGDLSPAQSRTQKQQTADACAAPPAQRRAEAPTAARYSPYHRSILELGLPSQKDSGNSGRRYRSTPAAVLTHYRLKSQNGGHC